MKKATRDALDEIHHLLAKHIAAKLLDGTATAADMAVARQFLKDNGVDNLPTKGDHPMNDIARHLPFPSPEEVEKETSSDRFH